MKGKLTCSLEKHWPCTLRSWEGGLDECDIACQTFAGGIDEVVSQILLASKVDPVIDIVHIRPIYFSYLGLKPACLSPVNTGLRQAGAKRTPSRAVAL